MKNSMKKILALTLALVMALSAFTACGNGGTEPAKAENKEPAATAAPASAEDAEKAEYPLANGDKTLTVYIRDGSAGVAGNYGNIAGFQAAAEKLGVNLEFIHPAGGSEADQFNLMIASGTYPDIIVWDFTTTPMGLDELIDAGVLLNMDPYIRQYAPNYLAHVESDPVYGKETRSNDGQYKVFYTFTVGMPLSDGPCIRADLLEKHNLDVPETVDDWENVLTVLKNEGAQYPLTAAKNWVGKVNFDLLLPAYKTTMEFNLDENGQVVYGPATENFKEYLAKLNAWYTAGLIDTEFMSNDAASRNSKLVSGDSVAATLALNSGIGNISRNARTENPDFTFVGTAWPTLNAGEKAGFVLQGGVTHIGIQAAVTTACAEPELATKVLDYFYTEEGNTQISWGIENESYVVNADGTKSYTEAITNAPDGKSPSEAILQYALPLYGFVNAMDADAYIELALTLPEQRAARELWQSLDVGVTLPKLIMAKEDQNDYNMIMNEVDTYVQEMYIKFITGEANLEGDWEAYVNVLNGMDLEHARQIIEAAYSEFQNR